VGLLVLRRFLEDGHKIIILTGGGTGMIGDPGGKSEERNLLDEETVARNSKAVAAQIKRVFGGGEFIEENNAKWLGGLNLLEFLRDVGKHFTVNAMIKKDIVKDRLDVESPISFTEFSYSLLQGYDFLHLNEQYGCDVQVGGSDQWSNILAGVEFIRRKAGKTVYAFTWPLVMNKSTGKKFGKSEQGAIWLDSKKTSIFNFYQFWLNTEDAAIEEYLLKMTPLETKKIDEIMAVQRENPGARFGQRRLAWEATALVHGREEATRAERISDVLFADAPLRDLPAADRKEIIAAAPSHAVRTGAGMLDILVESALAGSKREARQFIESGAVTLNGAPVSDVERTLSGSDFSGGLALLKRGKRTVRVLTQD
jgi:tyrosyl-tRNA synthetase